jgi:hypothetical protein
VWVHNNAPADCAGLAKKFTELMDGSAQDAAKAAAKLANELGPEGAADALRKLAKIEKPTDEIKLLRRELEAAQNATGGTYKLKDVDGNVKRTGQTDDLKRCEGQHASKPETKDLEFEVDKRSDSYPARRGREQII